MPELPEITHMTNSVQSFKNGTLKTIVFSPYSKYYKKTPANLNQIKLPVKVKNIYNIGKRIFIILDGEYQIIMNMGLTGDMTPIKDEKYNSISFNFSNNKSFYVNDVRKFATIRIVNNIEKYIKELGYDPLHHKLSFEEFYSKYIQKKKSTQTLALKLMDQGIFAGLGNYLRAEILYDTRIDPFCIFNNVPKKYWKKIYKSYGKLSKIHYDNDITYKEYLDFKAYTRKDKPNIITKDISGRTLWYDPNRIKYKC